VEKILWFDVETGGTDEKTDALLQLSALVEINGEIVEEIDLKMQPLRGKLVKQDAIEKHGMTIETIKSFQVAHVCHTHFEAFLLRHNPNPTKPGRYIMAGYNPEFDCRFLSQWYQDITGGPYDYWKHLQFSPLDVLPTLRAMRYHGVLDLPDTKLETCCKHFGIEIKAHDALSDIKATRELTKLVFGKLFSGWKGVTN
jgi:DNA polymerase III subunit epsilon